ncbi:MAG: LGFP repeat-containing protein [Anaerolineae bacterium]
MRRARSLLIVAVIATALLGSASATHSQAPDCRYFAETGHWVCSEFLELFDTRGGLGIFGFPITEAFNDPRLGLRVQYFQNARMEWHPYNPDPYKVQLGLLVDELGYDFPPASQEQIPSRNSALHHYFPETGHVVSYAFLDYFRENGGLDIFGYPRSEFIYEDGYIVQYFQRARMEWHPEVLSGSQMRLTKLGEIYVERFDVLDENYYNNIIKVTDNPPEPTVTKLNTSASVRYVITGRQGTQTVFVYVNDQRQQPVEGAAVRVIVHYQSGDQSYEFAPTNGSGFTRLSFEILQSSPGQRVVIDVTVTYGSLTATTQTFFLPWW